MTIYFVRHGESELNAQDRHQFSDTPLSADGMQQAAQVAQRFQAITIEQILASTCLRAHQTAEAIQQVTKAPLTSSDLLVEARQPTLFLGRPTKNDPEIDQVKKHIREHYHDPRWHYSDEENIHDVRDRAVEFLTQLKQRSEKSLCLVSHGGMIRMLVGLMLFGEKMTSQEYVRWQLFAETSNTGLSVCTHRKDSWKLMTWNDSAHLG